MRYWFTICVLSLVFLFSTATISLGIGVFGETDLMVTPTANTLVANSLGLAVNFQEDHLNYFNFDYGLVSDLEAGAAVYNYFGQTQVTLRGKYRLLKENKSQPGLAIGIEDLGSDWDPAPYLTVTKSFEQGVRGYIGAGGGAFDGLFAGISKTFVMDSSENLSKLQLLLEAVGSNLNLGAKLELNSNACINFGLVDLRSWVVGATFLLK